MEPEQEKEKQAGGKLTAVIFGDVHRNFFVSPHSMINP
jgi:hypothetical protein